MRYFDTSFLVPLILPEATSEPIAGFFEDLPTEDLAVSHWTRVEFASLLAREVRMGNLDASAARRAGSRFENDGQGVLCHPLAEPRRLRSGQGIGSAILRPV